MEDQTPTRSRQIVHNLRGALAIIQTNVELIGKTADPELRANILRAIQAAVNEIEKLERK